MLWHKSFPPSDSFETKISLNVELGCLGIVNQKYSMRRKASLAETESSPNLPVIYIFGNHNLTNPLGAVA